MRVALIGCGSIGRVLAEAIDSGEAGKAELAWVYDLKPRKSEQLVKELRSKPRIAKGSAEMLADKTVQLVIEAASQKAVKQYSLEVLNSDKDLMVMSVGAFCDENLFDSVCEAAKRARRTIYVPSGAILGIDGLKAAKLGGIEEVTLMTGKPPSALRSKYLSEHGIDLTNLTKPKTVFEGSAREAVRAFPESVNVAATLSLAGLGLDKTKVRIIADPSLGRNVHQIRVRGKSGEHIIETQNFPSIDNPETSYLAALSAVQTLRNLTEAIRIGT